MTRNRTITRTARGLMIGAAGALVGLVAVPVAGAGPRAAQSSTSDSTRLGRVESRVVLPPVSSLDFQSSVPERAHSKSTDEARLSGQVLVVSRSEPGRSFFSLPGIRREVQGLWRLELTSQEEIQNLHVEYDVVAPDGSVGRFSLVSKSSSQIGVRAVPLAPQVVERGHGRVVIEGGASLDLDLMPATEAGNYRGTIRVTVTRL